MATMKQWKVTGKGGFDDLKLEENAAIPDVGDKEVLVKRKSINHKPIKQVKLINHIKSIPRR
jgi:hypothetical protein